MAGDPAHTRFNGSAGPTIGVEAELFLVDLESLDLTDGAQAILAACADDSPGDDPRIKGELLDSLIEVNTGICGDVAQVRRDLTGSIAKVRQTARELNMGLVSMGTHPFARWSDAHVSRDPRYQNILRRMEFPVRRLLIAGLHVHIGVPDGSAAVKAVNALLRYVPHFIALAANSPFWDGDTTGLASTRMKVFEGMPTTGLPPPLGGYGEFEKLVATLVRADAIESIRDIWWDIRPHPGFGTVEIRLMDAPPSINSMVLMAAFSQCLVQHLLEAPGDSGETELLPVWVVEENKWRAVRHGMAADIIIDGEGQQQALRSNLLNLLADLESTARTLGCARELEQLARAAEGREPGSIQLQRYAASGNLQAVVRGAMEDLAASL